MKTKPFNLEEALANPDRVVCRDGVKPSDLHYFRQVEEWRYTRPGSAAIYETRNDGRYRKESFHYFDLLLRCETKLVPFTRETFMPHKDRWINYDGGLTRVVQFDLDGVTVTNSLGRVVGIVFKGLINKTFEDGTPCGREVEE